MSCTHFHPKSSYTIKFIVIIYPNGKDRVNKLILKHSDFWCFRHNVFTVKASKPIYYAH